jgi:hypothetical protein
MARSRKLLIKSYFWYLTGAKVYPQLQGYNPCNNEQNFLVPEGYKINNVVHCLVFFGRYTDDTSRNWNNNINYRKKVNKN